MDPVTALTLAIISCPTIAGHSGVEGAPGYVDREWDYQNSQLHCHKDIATVHPEPGQVVDLSEPTQCAMWGARMAGQVADDKGRYYVFAVGCPSKIVNKDPVTGAETVIGYQLPPCPSKVVCDPDPSEI